MPPLSKGGAATAAEGFEFGPIISFRKLLSYPPVTPETLVHFLVFTLAFVLYQHRRFSQSGVGRTQGVGQFADVFKDESRFSAADGYVVAGGFAAED